MTATGKTGVKLEIKAFDRGSIYKPTPKGKMVYGLSQLTNTFRQKSIQEFVEYTMLKEPTCKRLETSF